MSDSRCKGGKFKSQPDQVTFIEIDHEILCTVNTLPFSLIQDEQFMLLVKVGAHSTGFRAKEV